MMNTNAGTDLAVLPATEQLSAILELTGNEQLELDVLGDDVGVPRASIARAERFTGSQLERCRVGFRAVLLRTHFEIGDRPSLRRGRREPRAMRSSRRIR